MSTALRRMPSFGKFKIHQFSLSLHFCSFLPRDSLCTRLLIVDSKLTEGNCCNRRKGEKSDQSFNNFRTHCSCIRSGNRKLELLSRMPPSGAMLDIPFASKKHGGML